MYCFVYYCVASREETDAILANVQADLLNMFAMQTFTAPSGFRHESLGDAQTVGASRVEVRADYLPHPAVNNTLLTYMANMERLKTSVGSVRWWVIVKLLHPESDLFAYESAPPSDSRASEGYHPRFHALDKRERWPRGRSEQMLVEGLRRIARIIYPSHFRQ